MLTIDNIVDALDDLRNGTGAQFDQILNWFIRRHGVRDDDLRDEIRSDVYEALASKICDGVPSVEIAPQISAIVRNKVIDYRRRRTMTLTIVEYGTEDQESIVASVAIEDECIAREEYGAVWDALCSLRDSDKKADRRHFAVLDAARIGEPPAERLRRDFGEDITDGAAAQVLCRAREKLRELCGMPKGEKAS